MSLIKFEYYGYKITFSSGDTLMVNATQMAKPFGRRVNDWMGLPSTNRFMTALGATRKSGRLIKTVNGVGTWMHEDVAIEFARWLAPEFAIWCNDRIKELMKHGFTASEHTLNELIQDPDLLIGLATELKAERARADVAEARVAIASKTIQEQAPKVHYHDEVLISQSTFTTTSIAKELGMGAPSLHKELHRRGIMYKVDGHWVLYHQYQGKGFTKTRTSTYDDRYGQKQTTITTVWTEKGREFIHRKLNPELKPA